MSCEPDSGRVLHAHGLRRTEQRSRVLAVLRHGGGHLTAAEVHAGLGTAPGHPISLSTVYRTLEGLEVAGIVASLDVGHGAMAFEWSAGDETHHHLVCQRCGSSTELGLPRLAGLRDDIRRLTGFEAAIRHLGITGLCRACVEKRGNDAQPARIEGPRP